MPRFLHTADWQMGRRYKRFEADDAAALAEARFAAVERLAELARAERCDAVLVAGDVFDAQTVSDRTIRRVFNAISGFAGPWIMLSGNHDAALAESVWTRARRLGAVPDTIRLALEPGVVELPEQGMAILAAPLTQRHTYDDLTAQFDHLDSPPGLLRIGLAHGSVQGVLPDTVDAINPIAPDRAARARLDYLALGDWHGVKRIDSRTWYSGTPEPERFRNNEAGYALVVDIAAPGAEPAVRPHWTGKYQWHQWLETLHVSSDIDALLDRLAAVSPEAVIAIELAGQVDLAGEQKLAQALSVAQARHRSVQCDRTGLSLQPTDEDIAALHADGYLGDVIDELRDREQEARDSRAREALAILAGMLRERDARHGCRRRRERVMKLQRLRVEQLRQFRQPFVIDGLVPGLNLFYGPNESGKSTLVRAIRAAFFERHRSSSIEDLRPWNDSAAAPSIELAFECQGLSWQLQKSFLQRKRCDLQVADEAFRWRGGRGQAGRSAGLPVSRPRSQPAQTLGYSGPAVGGAGQRPGCPGSRGKCR